jgi:hypothetical protein
VEEEVAGARVSDNNLVVWDCGLARDRRNSFFYLLVALVGNLMSYLWAKSETKSLTPDTAFRFNSKDIQIMACIHVRSGGSITNRSSPPLVCGHRPPPRSM